MPIPVSGQVGEQQLGQGVTTQPLRQGRLADVIVSELSGRYYEMSRSGRLYLAHAIVTAPVAYTTAAGLGGPLVWNPPTSGVNVVVLSIGVGITVVTTAAAALGLTGNSGQVSAPTSTTAIDSSGNMFIGSPAGAAKPFRVGTVVNAGAFFLPLLDLHTGALTVDNLGLGWIDIGGALIIPPGAYGSVAASVAATATVAQIGMLYSEVPV